MGKRRNKYWTVLKTKQASSSDAVENVRKQDFEYFHPTFRQRSVRGVRRISALFPFYLMVRIDEMVQDWRVLCSTRGVSSVLLSGETPGRIRDEVVQDLRVLTDDSVDGYYHDPVHETPRFDADAPVLGLRGLFADKFGVYKGLAGNNAARCRVLFSFLGREAEFEVRAEDLAAA